MRKYLTLDISFSLLQKQFLSKQFSKNSFNFFIAKARLDLDPELSLSGGCYENHKYPETTIVKTFEEYTPQQLPFKITTVIIVLTSETDTK